MTGIIPPQRGMLMRVGHPEDFLDFHFNPTNMTVTKNPRFTPHKPPKGVKPGRQQEFLGVSPATLRMKLLFDSVSDLGMPRSVGKAIDTLKTWTMPTRHSMNLGKPAPPTLQLKWGLIDAGYFPPCRITNLRIQYTRFDRDGTPSRANVTVTFTEAADTLGPQNPTSGGIVGRRSVTTDAGDTLAAIAFAEYGNPNMWRALAEANGIDDPLRLRPGVTLFVPAKPDAERLVRGGDV
jgi:nucleoid-associated protein YgaU